jgi:hypothetical protein
MRGFYRVFEMMSTHLSQLDGGGGGDRAGRRTCVLGQRLQPGQRKVRLRVR